MPQRIDPVGVACGVGITIFGFAFAYWFWPHGVTDKSVETYTASDWFLTIGSVFCGCVGISGIAVAVGARQEDRTI